MHDIGTKSRGEFIDSHVQSTLPSRSAEKIELDQSLVGGGLPVAKRQTVNDKPVDFSCGTVVQMVWIGG